MAKYCSDCKYLDGKLKENGIYKCYKNNKNTLANKPACPKFENAYARRSYQKEALYDSSNKNKEYPLLLFIILFIFLSIAKIFIG